jgi:hypothetical protein
VRTVEKHKEFRISSKAKQRILEVLTPVKADPKFEKLEPVLTWFSGDSSDDELIPGPNLGMSGKLPARAMNFYQVDSWKVWICLDGERLEECRTKVLDYRKKQFCLIYEDDYY